MSKDDKKPGVLHSFLGGLILTIVLVVVIPAVTAYFIGPIVNEYLGDVTFWELTPSTVVTAVMLLVMILFLILLGGGAIFKKYGVLGVVGLIIAYWALGNIYDAILPVVIIILLTLFTIYKDRKK
jgi:hypothetical protein